MPAPVCADDFLSVVEKSRLLAPDALATYRSRASADPHPPQGVADWMINDGRITPFQAELLLAGKSRPFFVGPYKVLSRIGNGSMGVVYLCEHVDMRRRVALKVLQGRRAKDQVALQRFLREARAAAAINHPNVVHALDLGCEGDLHYLSMEYIDGVSLKELVRVEGPLEPRRIADYMRQAALGLQHAHDAGLIHRDIKPSNLMIDRVGIVKILDLGLALFAEGDEELTQGVQLGDIAFAAPEQTRDSHTVDARADIYSLGTTFYLAATGRQPLPAMGITDNTPPPHARETADFTRLMSTLQRMTATNPDHRHQTASEVVEDIVAWITPPSRLQPVVPPTVPDVCLPEPDLIPATVPEMVLSGGTDSDDVLLASLRPTNPEVILPRLPPPLPAKGEFAFEASARRNAATPRIAKVAAALARTMRDPGAIKEWVVRWRWPLALSAAAFLGLLLAIATR